MPRTSDFSGPDKLIMLFCLLINVEMPTIVGILKFMSRKAELNMKFVEYFGAILSKYCFDGCRRHPDCPRNRYKRKNSLAAKSRKSMVKKYAQT